ncbi:hypothetical protein BU15DRAFT_68071 [Melanogaster broomeanus]|nr:hypothetical protein BU15DRAFT_68071 [Melanogaster broomeanus]
MALTSTQPHTINQLCDVVQLQGTNIAYRVKTNTACRVKMNTACRVPTLCVQPIPARIKLCHMPIHTIHATTTMHSHNDDDSPTCTQRPSMCNSKPHTIHTTTTHNYDDNDSLTWTKRPSTFDSEPWHDNPLTTLSLMMQHARMAK